MTRPKAERRWKAVSVTVALLAVVGACTSSQEPHSVPPRPLMPVAIGSRWDYGEIFTAEGETLSVDTTSMIVTGTVAPSGVQYFTTTWALVFAPHGDSVSVAWYDAATDSLTGFEVLLRYPLASFDPYVYQTPFIPGLRSVFITPSADTITTLVGRLPRINYAVGPPLSVSFGFSPGVGLVTMHNRFGTYWVLKSYSPAAGRPSPAILEPNIAMNPEGGAGRAP